MGISIQKVAKSIFIQTLFTTIRQWLFKTTTTTTTTRQSLLLTLNGSKRSKILMKTITTFIIQRLRVASTNMRVSWITMNITRAIITATTRVVPVTTAIITTTTTIIIMVITKDIITANHLAQDRSNVDIPIRQEVRPQQRSLA
mmetsp:Transcript_2734/g.6115  ORF Transcript_2734/g.6115 Transcript_2734/m.6115 type:complete len:144 (-) Transcript_2734:158-589(-)